ncbi:MAG: hypothetical protein EHM12_07905 [Dehalococcoidia bacterium]|nr:MAG: hypothetical protein EHM12_07905 [Dehalococcoidia bacterium]
MKQKKYKLLRREIVCIYRVKRVKFIKIAHSDRGDNMRAAAEKINPEDFILSILSPKDRLDAALKVAGEAFKKTELTVKDIENAVRSVRRRAYEKKK